MAISCEILEGENISFCAKKNLWILKYLLICVHVIIMILEQILEETREELQRATEAESSLRNRCASLEKKLIQKKEQIEVAPSIIIHISNTS